MFVLVAQGHIVWWLSSEDKGKVLENFKREEYEMIFESDASLISGEDSGILSTARKINIYNTIWDKIKTKREYLEYQNKKILSRVSSLEDSIAELDDSIEDIIREVSKINYEIIETKKQIDTNKKTVTLLKKKVEDNTKVLLEYISYMYKKWEYVSHNSKMDTLKTLILSGDDVSEIVDDLHYKWVIQLTGKKLIEKHRNYISSLYVKKLELEKDETKLKQLRKSWMLERSVLDDKRASKKRLLEITKGKEDLYKKYIEQKLAIEKNIQIQELKERIKFHNAREKLLKTHGCDFVDITQNVFDTYSLSSECFDINKIIYAESKLKDIDITENPFLWPINPRNGISAYFRDDEYRHDFKADHDAIDIIAAQSTEIRAPADWYIVHIEPPVTSAYSYVAIKHGSWLVTIYGHLSDIMVSNYDYVKKGEVFALSWWEYGTKWAGILTTGPHLHFGVYQDKKYADPLEFLDISHLSYSSLPEQYAFKFKSDFKNRKWYDYTVVDNSWNKFIIKWDSEVERQKYLLNTYAVWPFRNWNIWIEESIDAGLDPTFVMCIGLAETNLWKYLKTPYNVGNVWNTDSGATKTFKNARSWVYAMAQTLNNKFLWGYTQIQQLSRYGNKDGTIYASSELNWHRNIVKCMSHVKWEFVPDDYRFRIAQD